MSLFHSQKQLMSAFRISYFPPNNPSLSVNNPALSRNNGGLLNLKNSTKKVAKRFGYFSYYLYLCIVIEITIAKREGPPDVDGPLDNIIP